MAKKSQIQYGSPAGGTTAAAADGPAGKPKGLLIAGGAVLAALVIALIVFAVQDGGGAGVNKNSFSPSIEVSGTALPVAASGQPDGALGMTLPTITGTDFDGNPVTIEPGEPMMVVVMAHWCGHCQAEIPRIVEYVNDGKLSKDVKIVGLSTAVNESSGNFPPASWLEKEKWTFPVLADNRTNDARNALGVDGYPGLLAVNADGIVTYRTSGQQDLAGLQTLFAAALGDDAAEAPTEETTSTTAAAE